VIGIRYSGLVVAFPRALRLFLAGELGTKVNVKSGITLDYKVYNKGCLRRANACMRRYSLCVFVVLPN
jgi:hypothetical protein